MGALFLLKSRLMTTIVKIKTLASQYILGTLLLLTGLSKQALDTKSSWPSNAYIYPWHDHIKNRTC